MLMDKLRDGVGSARTLRTPADGDGSGERVGAGGVASVSGFTKVLLVDGHGSAYSPWCLCFLFGSNSAHRSAVDKDTRNHETRRLHGTHLSHWRQLKTTDVAVLHLRCNAQRQHLQQSDNIVVNVAQYRVRHV